MKNDKFLPVKVDSTLGTVKKNGGNPFNRDCEAIICSYHFAHRYRAWITGVQWDLAVIDEAHHLRNVHKAQNVIAKSIKEALKNVKKLLLTATPLHNTIMELFSLVSVIDEYIFGDIGSFKSKFSKVRDETGFNDLKERLRPVCKRTLRKQVLEYVRYTNRTVITQEFVSTPEERNLYELVPRYLRKVNLCAFPKSQRPLITLILRKLMSSFTFAISVTLGKVADRLEGLLDEDEMGKGDGKKLDFEGYISQEMESYGEISDEWSEEEEKSVNFCPTPADIRMEVEELRALEKFAKAITSNSKGKVLMQALRRGFREIERIGGSRKAIIFTESTRTQRYINGILQKTEFAGKTVLFNGSNNDRESERIYREWLMKNNGSDKITAAQIADRKSAIVEYFRDEAVIMIATEAAAEGMNLQFCSMVVNYDLPWNPQRIEQRIGRCHRYGQKFDVVVVNFLDKENAADRRVYELLSAKFRLFDGVFGASDEIIGSIESGTDFERRISEIYQNCRTEAQISHSFDELQRELEEQIKENVGNARRQLLENFDEEVQEKLRINKSVTEGNISKYDNMLWTLTRHYLEKGSFAKFAPGGRSFALEKAPFEGIQIGTYLTGSDAGNGHIYRIGHPLAQGIIEESKSVETPFCELVFDFSGGSRNISTVRELVGKSGCIGIWKFSMEALETEEHIIPVGFVADGEHLDGERCRRLLSLPARKSLACDDLSDDNQRKLEHLLKSQEKGIIDRARKLNTEFFNQEIEKLDKWQDDKYRALQEVLNKIEKEISGLKSNFWKAYEKDKILALQKKIAMLERRQMKEREDFFKKSKEISAEKDRLLNGIHAKMTPRTSKEHLFTIRWRVV